MLQNIAPHIIQLPPPPVNLLLSIFNIRYPYIALE